MEYKDGIEGATKLRLPVSAGISKDEEVFFNPHMALNRDLTVALARSLGDGEMVDVMAGSGARGIRVANEAGWRVTLNDLNPKACELMRSNLDLNCIEAQIVSMDARRLFSEGFFDLVDVDPFGTPAPYMEAAIGGTRHKGIIAACATDTSALCGSHPKACQRKYSSQSLRTDYYNEAGLRILLGFAARTALRNGKGFHPLISHATRHYMRMQARLTRDTRDTLASVSYLQHCFGCLWRGYRGLDELERICSCGAPLRTCGPLWTGAFCDKKMLASMSQDIGAHAYQKPDEMAALFTRLSAEQETHIPYYDLHKLCRLAKTSSPTMDSFREAVEDAGGSFCRTHFVQTGFRSGLSAGQLTELLN